MFVFLFYVSRLVFFVAAITFFYGSLFVVRIIRFSFMSRCKQYIFYYATTQYGQTALDEASFADIKQLLRDAQARIESAASTIRVAAAAAAASEEEH
jgi:hypothetical protein